jgi:hypothetical protein
VKSEEGHGFRESKGSAYMFRHHAITKLVMRMRFELHQVLWKAFTSKSVCKVFACKDTAQSRRSCPLCSSLGRAGGWPEEVSSKCLFTSYCGWEKLLEMSAQQGNDEQNDHDSNNGDQDKRQNLLFLPLLVPIVRNFRLLRQASTFLHLHMGRRLASCWTRVRAVVFSGYGEARLVVYAALYALECENLLPCPASGF